MPETRSEAELAFFDSKGSHVATATIYSDSQEDGEEGGVSGIDSRELLVLDESESEELNEEEIQLLENRSYEYRITESTDEGLRLRESSVVKRSNIESSWDRGAIEVGGRVGVLQLTVEDQSGQRIGTAAVEVRSRKMGYREDFRQMISDIAERSCDLLMRAQSPSSGRFRPNPGANTERIAQQLAFVRSLLTSEDFRQAITQVVRNPHVEMVSDREEKSVRRGLKPDSKTGAQMARGRPRMPLPDGHSLREKIGSVPQKVRSTKRRDTTDTAENRFVRHVLRTFSRFLDDTSQVLEDNSGEDTTNANKRLLREIRELNREVNEKLNDDFFRELSPLSKLPLGSTVLQRRTGYRKILKVWFQFRAAARLGWEGGEDVYQGGQRNISKLYQYWLFFYLFDSVCEEFELPSIPADDLFEETKDGLGLKLETGEELSVRGTCRIGRPLHVEFSYERTFTSGAGYKEVGSWTRKMTPDYTLSLWPLELEKGEAQELELLTHVHFDAKYRAREFTEMVSGESGGTSLENDEVERKRQKAETSDLQKAHTYRDAIRQTEGTFILYPGDRTETRRLYREILPGVGALAVNPSSGEGEALSRLLREIAEHTSDRATRREQERYHSQLAHSAPSPYRVREQIPELDSEGCRSLPPLEHRVLVYSDSLYRLDKWIRLEGYVALPVQKGVNDIGSLQAKHILLWDSQSGRPLNIYRRFPPRSTRIYSECELDHRGYPGPTEPRTQHIVLGTLQIPEKWSENITSWNRNVGESKIESMTLAEMIGETREVS